MSVIPSSLRMNHAYVVLYITWVWGFLTCQLITKLIEIQVTQSFYTIRLPASADPDRAKQQGVPGHADDEEEGPER